MLLFQDRVYNTYWLEFSRIASIFSVHCRTGPLLAQWLILRSKWPTCPSLEQNIVTIIPICCCHAHDTVKGLLRLTAERKVGMRNGRYVVAEQMSSRTHTKPQILQVKALL